MKLAFICETIGTNRFGGEHHAMLNVANTLEKLGHHIDVYTYTSSDEYLKIKSSIPLKLRLLPFIRDIFFLPLIGKSLLKKIDSRKYDGIFASSTTFAAFYKPKTLYATVCHIIRSQKFEVFLKLPQYKLFFNNFTKALIVYLEKSAFENSDLIIVIRERQKEFLLRDFKLKNKNIKIIPNGINTNIFKPLKIPKKNQIIFVGRGTIPKGLDTLLKAMDLVNGNLLVVTQKIDNKLRLIAESKENVKITYNASSEELAKLYSESKVFVLPSLDEEQPLTTLEAMACGVPVVVTKKAASNVVQNSVNGYIVPPNNYKALAHVINEILADENKMGKMSDNNRKKISNDFRLTDVAEKYANYLNKV